MYEKKNKIRRFINTIPPTLQQYKKNVSEVLVIPLPS